MLVQLKQIGWVLQSFYYKTGGKGEVCTKGEGKGNSKLWMR